MSFGKLVFDKFGLVFLDSFRLGGRALAPEAYWQTSESDFDALILAASNPKQNPTYKMAEMAGNEEKGVTDLPRKPLETSVFQGEEWAMRDSNLRPPACKAGALTN